MCKIYFIFTIIVIIFKTSFCNNDYPLEDGFLNFTELAAKYAVKPEEHDVITEDGYILKLFHVPGDRRKPILLMHGLIGSADDYIIRGDISTVATLSRAGYDIWLGNCRGNKFSRRHLHLNPDNDKQFWDFSFHEYALYDLPAFIDHVLDATGEERLSTLGYSLGTTIFYVLGSMRPEYNEKIKVLISLAPVCFVHHLGKPVSTMINLYPIINSILVSLGIDEVFRNVSMAAEYVKAVCIDGVEACARRIYLLFNGQDEEEFEPKFFSILHKHHPSATSRKTGIHLAQNGVAKRFSQFDYGETRNLQVYKSIVPPDYDLSKVTMKTVLIAAKNDKLSSLKDVALLREALPNVVDYHVMERKKFNHLDHIWGRHMNDYTYPYLFEMLEKYNS